MVRFYTNCKTYDKSPHCVIAIVTPRKLISPGSHFEDNNVPIENYSATHEAMFFVSDAAIVTTTTTSVPVKRLIGMIAVTTHSAADAKSPQCTLSVGDFLQCSRNQCRSSQHSEWSVFYDIIRRLHSVAARRRLLDYADALQSSTNIAVHRLLMG